MSALSPSISTKGRTFAILKADHVAIIASQSRHISLLKLLIWRQFAQPTSIVFIAI